MDEGACNHFAGGPHFRLAGHFITFTFECHMRRLIASVACLAWAIVPAVLHGQTFSTSNGNNLRGWYIVGGVMTNINVCATATDLTGSCAVSGLSMLATSSANGGTLRAQAQLSLTQAGPVRPLPTGVENWGYTVSAFGILQEQITFTGTLPAYLRFFYALDGVRTATSVDGVTNLAPGGRVYFGARQGGTASLNEVYLSKEDGPNSRSVPVAYSSFTDVGVLGTAPMNVALEILATATINSGNPTAVLNGSVNADFAHTLVWSARAFDQAGNDITEQAGLRFASQTVPEPSTILLTSVGLLAVCVVARRGRRTT